MIVLLIFRFKICQALRKSTSNQVNDEFYPNNCTNAPKPNSAFCIECEPQVAALGYPTKLNEFLEFCGCNIMSYTKDEKKKRTKVLEDIGNDIEVRSETVGDQTGTSMILRSSILKENDTFKLKSDDDKTCNKDLVGLVTKNTYSRGHVFYVHSSGIIRLVLIKKKCCIFSLF